MLQKQIIEVPLAAGIDTKTSAKVVQPGALLDLKNAVLTNPGELRKRPGYLAMSPFQADGTRVAGIKKIYSDGDSLLAISNDDTAYALDSIGSRWKGVGTVGAYSPTVSSLAQLESQTSGTLFPLCVALNGYAVVMNGTLTAGSTSRYSIVNLEDGGVIKDITTISSFAAMGGCTLKDRYIVFTGYSASSAADLKAYFFDTQNISATPTSVNFGAGIADVDFGEPITLPLTGTCAVAYNKTGTFVVRILEFDENGATGNFVDYTGGNIGYNVMCVDDDGYICYAGGQSAPEAVVIDPAWTAAAGPTALTVKPKLAIIKQSDGTGFDIYGTLTASDLGGLDEERYIQKQTISQAAAVGAATTIVRGVSPGGQIFRKNGIDYMTAFMETNDNLQNSVFVVDTSGNALSRVLVNNGTYVRGPAYVSGDSVYVWGANQKVITGTYYANSAHAIKLDFGRLGNSARIGSSYFFVASQLYEFDGLRVVEHGFAHYPSKMTLTESATGNLTALGSYQYIAVYSWLDKSGNRHYSQTSTAVSITLTGANKTVSAKVPTLKMTQKNDVKILLYRTVASGTVFYKVKEANNDTTANIVTITDNLADSTITSYEQLYTYGGVLDNLSPPSPVAIASHDHRLFAITSKNEVWHSKRIQEERGVEFSDSFRLVFDQRGGSLAALQSQDSQLVLARERLISRITGNGPDDTGIGEFSITDVVASDVGAYVGSPMSETSVGTIFKSSTKGLRLLDRSLQTAYIGAPVEAYNDQYLSDMLIHPSRNDLLFAHKTGLVLRLDAHQNQWVVDDAIAGLGVVSVANRANKLFALTTGGHVLREDSNTFDDMGRAYPLDVTTPWIKLAGLAGYQRVWWVYILGEFVSPHRLNVWVHYDYKDEPAEKLSTRIENGNADYLMRIKPAKQKCGAIKLRIYDTEQSGTKESMRLSVARFEIGAKPKRTSFTRTMEG